MPFDISCFLPLPPYLPKLLKVLSKILLHTVRTQSTNKDSFHLRQKGRGGGGGGEEGEEGGRGEGELTTFHLHTKIKTCPHCE